MTTQNRLNLEIRDPQIIKTVIVPVSNVLKTKVTTAINAIATAIKNKHL